MSHKTIPIFIPHIGCPHNCVFCDQRSISGTTSFDECQVPSIIDNALTTVGNQKPEIAYFGGSFTGIEKGLMISLLETAKTYVENGKCSAIRFSTRPDYITDEILQILKDYPISTIELGLQSFSDDVLKASGRGHTTKDSYLACEKILKAGYTLGGQMMIGLPSSTPEQEIETAKEIVKIGAKETRIYPTIVYRHTPLAKLTEQGLYTPLTLEDAVKRSADCADIFLKNQVRILRIGVHASPTLTDKNTVLAGPNAPALGEMVYSRLAYQELLQLLTDCKSKRIDLYVPFNRISLVVGQHRENLVRLQTEKGITVEKVLKTDAEKLSYQPK